MPTAIYCFLRTTKKSENIQDSLRQTVEFTISIGGDTDTIASMACALSGAYYGENAFFEKLIRHLEGSDETLQLADKLFEVASK